jgi:hypothetical protein
MHGTSSSPTSLLLHEHLKEDIRVYPTMASVMMMVPTCIERATMIMISRWAPTSLLLHEHLKEDIRVYPTMASVMMMVPTCIERATMIMISRWDSSCMSLTSSFCLINVLHFDT